MDGGLGPHRRPVCPHTGRAVASVQGPERAAVWEPWLRVLCPLPGAEAQTSDWEPRAAERGHWGS